VLLVQRLNDNTKYNTHLPHNRILAKGSTGLDRSLDDYFGDWKEIANYSRAKNDSDRRQAL